MVDGQWAKLIVNSNASALMGIHVRLTFICFPATLAADSEERRRDELNNFRNDVDDAKATSARRAIPPNN